MRSEDALKIQNEICPLIDKGDVSLLLGAGFSYGSATANGSTIPSGDGLRDIFLRECGKTGGVRTTLKDAYLLASRTVPDFNLFLDACFTVSSAKDWQRKLFRYAWNRIYTTNIDNLLDIAHREASVKFTLGGEFTFINYSEPHLANNAIGLIPIVSIHGSIKKSAEGFIFSTLEYGQAASRVLDWHNELAAKIMVGGLVVIGNQLDETDIDAHLARRRNVYGGAAGGKNWIVMPDPDEIKRENYIASGFDVIDATAEEFFELVYSTLKPRSISEIILESLPETKRVKTNVRAMTWFKEAFRAVVHQLEEARKCTGILRHFVTGVQPDWFYIVNSAHARTSRIGDLVRTLGNVLRSADKGIRIVHIIGPSGSGKTTTIRAALQEVTSTYPYVYEYDSANGIDVDLLATIVRGFTAKTIMVFYDAAEFYYAVNAIANRFKDSDIPLCTFVLEDRSAEHRKSKLQLADCRAVSQSFEMLPLTVEDATSIAKKIDEHGQTFPNFSEYSLDRRAALIVSKERGYSGDLLSALFSLTTHENFEQKIYEDYSSVRHGLSRQLLEVIAVMNSLGYATPLRYAAGFLGSDVNAVADCIENELKGIVQLTPETNRLACRHRIIASYYFENLIAGNGVVDTVVHVLNYLSEQFTVDDIRYHPLAYQMYRDIISFDFLYEKYFPTETRSIDTERTYHEMQKVYGKDGIFWLHFGRYYRKVGQLDLAVDCFRTGLVHYDSFQTRHSFGTALLDKYVESGCKDENAYSEGIAVLDNQRLTRGGADPYPTCTLCNLLMKILAVSHDHQDAGQRLKDCINYGLKHFKGDEFFDRTVKDYFAQQGDH